MKLVKKSYTLKELATGLDATIKGDAMSIVQGVASIQAAQPGDITFLTNSLYRKYLPETKATAVILSEQDASYYQGNAIISSFPYHVYAKIAGYFHTTTSFPEGIHPSAVIDPSAVIHPSASIGPHCVVGSGVRIGAGVVLQAGCMVGDFSTIGEYSHIEPRVTIYHQVDIGQRAKIASGAVIGSDGFGFANAQGYWHKVPQLGGVSIGNDVDIGANTTIDRGAIDHTVIENGVKLDNLIQVGHNVRIGANTIIAGCVAIAGSTVIGKNCMVGGATCFAGHLHVCDGAVFTGMTAVTKSISQPGVYSSGIVGAVPNQEFRKNNARFHRLEQLVNRVKTLEAAFKNIEKR